MFLAINLGHGIIAEIGTRHEDIRRHPDCRDDGTYFGLRNDSLVFVGPKTQIHIHHPEKHGQPAIAYRPTTSPDVIIVNGCSTVSLSDPDSIEKHWPTGADCLHCLLKNLCNYLEVRQESLVAA